jgi:hypothetical protein
MGYTHCTNHCVGLGQHIAPLSITSIVSYEGSQFIRLRARGKKERYPMGSGNPSPPKAINTHIQSTKMTTLKYYVNRSMHLKEENSIKPIALRYVGMTNYRLVPLTSTQQQTCQHKQMLHASLLQQYIQEHQHVQASHSSNDMESCQLSKHQLRCTKPEVYTIWTIGKQLPSTSGLTKWGADGGSATHKEPSLAPMANLKACQTQIGCHQPTLNPC